MQVEDLADDFDGLSAFGFGSVAAQLGNGTVGDFIDHGTRHRFDLLALLTPLLLPGRKSAEQPEHP